MASFEIRLRDGTEKVSFKPIVRYGEVIRVITSEIVRFGVGSEIVISMNEMRASGIVLRVQEKVLYVYIRNTEPNALERRVLPRYECHQPCDLLLDRLIPGTIVNANWLGLTIDVPSEGDRLRLKMSKSLIRTEFKVKGKLLSLEMQIVHGKSARTIVGIQFLNVDEESFIHLCEWFSDHYSLRQKEPLPARWLDEHMQNIPNTN